MKHTGIKIKGYRMDKNGRIVKSQAHLDVSARLRQRGSKRVRVARRGSNAETAR